MRPTENLQIAMAVPDEGPYRTYAHWTQELLPNSTINFISKAYMFEQCLEHYQWLVDHPEVDLGTEYYASVVPGEINFGLGIQRSIPPIDLVIYEPRLWMTHPHINQSENYHERKEFAINKSYEVMSALVNSHLNLNRREPYILRFKSLINFNSRDIRQWIHCINIFSLTKEQDRFLELRRLLQAV